MNSACWGSGSQGSRVATKWLLCKDYLDVTHPRDLNRATTEGAVYLCRLSLHREAGIGLYCSMSLEGEVMGRHIHCGSATRL